ncbi:Uncharacterised protein [Proteus vulgaris]|uniref:DUF7079 family protein n=1 Tax=Proteus vulgaris TaxID=585 RepID=UPI000E065B8F|nr:hypothetical protein [Proteus vulgaris]SUC23945.1 Uncharacterised protein [Proteus vulgaris]
MDRTYIDKDHCAALPDIFVDNWVNFEYIASVAKHFPVGYVYLMLCRYVAPICYCNLLSPVPPVWTAFDADELWREIGILKKKEQSVFGKFKSYLCTLYFKNRLKQEWQELMRFLQN